MANTFTTELMPRILAGALSVLREEMGLAAKVTKDFNGAAGQLGQTVSVMVPVAQSVASVTPAATPPALTDSTPGVKQITIDQWKATRFHLSTKDATEIQAGVFVPNQIREAARSIARNVNQYLFGKYAAFYGYAGTAATNPFASNVNPVADVAEQLDYHLCPQDGRMLFINLAAQTAARKLTDLRYALYSGDSEALRRGFVGRLFGMDVFADRDVPSHTAGVPGGTPLVDGNHAAGATSLVIKGGGNAGTYTEGDVILLQGDSYPYVVTAALTLSAGGAGTATIQPPLRTAIADNATITLKATHTVNLACDPAAFGLVMRIPGSQIEGAPTYGEHLSMTDPQTGIPMKLSYLPGYEASQWQLSVLYGAAVIDPRRGARLAG